MANQNTNGETVFQAPNLSMTMKGTVLTITTDLAQDAGQTSGGNVRICSTGGNQAIADVKVGLNVYRKVAKAASAS